MNLLYEGTDRYLVLVGVLIDVNAFGFCQTKFDREHTENILCTTPIPKHDRHSRFKWSILDVMKECSKKRRNAKRY